MSTEFSVISHTHWDREWHMSFERFRMRLVALIDNLLDILKAEPDFIFHLDAQSICVEDYLQIRPYREQELRKYIKEKRILIGPWYVQNDFYLTSGEATVRNLLIGSRMAEEWGYCDTVGYAPDQFGNIAQLPQILQGFGIDNFIFGRGYKFPLNPGVDREFEKRPVEFYWKSKDGSKLLAVHLAYWYNNAQRFPADIDTSFRMVNGIEDDLSPRAATEHLLLMNGVDHLEAQEDLLPILAQINARLPKDKVIKQDTLSSYLDKLKNKLEQGNIELEEVQGELRNGWDVSLHLTNTASSRMYLKTRNAQAQVLLENKIEPLFTMIAMLGAADQYPKDYLLYLWKTLIQNHPHDSICGCSRDEVHAEMEGRNLKLFEAGEELLSKGTAFMSDHFDRSLLQSDEFLITVINTNESVRSSCFEVEMLLPKSDNIRGFSLSTLAGDPVEYTILEKRDVLYSSLSPINLPGVLDVEKTRVLVHLPEVPPFSVNYLKVTPTEDAHECLLQEGSLKYAKISNEFMEITVTAEGKAELQFTETGITYSDFFSIEDTADCGNSYEFIPDEQDVPLTLDDFIVKKITLNKSSLMEQVVIEYQLPLPSEYDYNSGQRSEEPVMNSLELEITLKRGEQYAEFSCSLNNRSKDHRLRFILNSGISADKVQVAAPYEIVERKQSDYIPNWNHGDSPNSGFITISNGDEGITLLTEGLYEYNHLQGDRGRIALTLVRSNGSINSNRSNVSEHWIAPENQCMREIDLRFAIYPHTGDALQANSVREMQNFLVPLLTHFDSADRKKFSSGRPAVQAAGVSEHFFRDPINSEIVLQGLQSFLSIEGEHIAVTACKRSEDGKSNILRFYNTSNDMTSCSITCFKPVTTALMLNLKEEPVKVLPYAGNSLETIILSPGQIITVAIEC
jgi:alpha-mannosidase